MRRRRARSGSDFSPPPKLGLLPSPFHRAAQQARGPNHGRDLGCEEAFDAEAAADVGRDHADLVLGKVQRIDREPAAQIVRLLARRVERGAVAPGVVVGEIGARLERVGGEPEESVMVGDTPWDVHAARRAGVETIAVLTGGFAIEELKESGALAVFESVIELCGGLDHTPLR